MRRERRERVYALFLIKTGPRFLPAQAKHTASLTSATDESGQAHRVAGETAQMHGLPVSTAALRKDKEKRKCQWTPIFR